METIDEVIEKKTMAAVIINSDSKDYINHARSVTPGVATSINFIDDKEASEAMATIFEGIHAKCLSQVFSDKEREQRIAALGSFFMQNSKTVLAVVIGTDSGDLSDFWAKAREAADGRPIIYLPPELEQTSSVVRTPAHEVANVLPKLRPAIA